jgi:hypothetical protein
VRKVIGSTLVSADGVIGDPHLWTGKHFGEEAVSRALEQLRRSDAMVMGRHCRRPRYSDSPAASRASSGSAKP